MAKKTAKLNVDKLLENENIITGDISEEIKTSMLSYSMLVILSRAIPDVLDGLKPAQRRILYSCAERKHDSDKQYVKCAKVSGEVMGDYHPHSSCYGTIANMSQDWEFRYPLIDFHGCNGSASGDSPAADRYTECRLAKIAYNLLEDVLDECSVDFKPNYSETTTEPIVLPGLLPNFLINGASGIAVGMTTHCPSHNLGEVCDALIYAIDNKDFTLNDLMKYIKGPDMPLGGCISSENLKELYSTGKGKVIYRANYEVEHNNENENPQIVFTDTTPNMNISKTLEKIYELISSKSLPKALEVRDESEGTHIRLVIECAKTANIPFIVNKLYDSTDLQKPCSYIMCGIHEKTPKIIPLTDYVNIYLENRRNVIKRRMEFLIDKENKKLEIQEGVAKILHNIKEVSKEIVDCEDDASAIAMLMNKYQLTEFQANYVLDRKFRSIVKKNVNAVFESIESLKKSIEEHKNILNDEATRDEYIKKELIDLKNNFSDERRTKIVEKFAEMSEEHTEAFIDAVVVLTNKNVKVYDKKEFDDSKLKDKSELYKVYFEAKINDEIYVLFKNSEVSSIKVKEIEDAKLKDVVTIFPVNLKKTLFTILKNGNIKKTEISKLKSGKKLIKDINSEIVCAKFIEDIEDEIVTVATEQGYVARFSTNSFTSTGMNAKAMPAPKLEDGDSIVDCEISSLKNNDKDIILVLAENNNNTYAYKVVKAKDALIKGRISKALRYCFGSKFKQLLKVNVCEKPMYYDDKNNLIEIKKFTFKNRLEKMDLIKAKPNTFNVEKL